ncbi:MAG: phosphatidylglycerophosphatase A [Acidobacteriota bacterium]|nr:phosphatidylglycerophosphatase A [Acidobacteriota bacterium]
MANDAHPTHPPAAHKTPWAWILGTFFGAGMMKPGPGTYGSVAALLLWMAAGQLLHPAPLVLAAGTAIAALLATLVGIPAATRVARESGRKDPGFVVIDEVAGQWITLIGLTATWRHALLGLALFRLFDILKPPPVRQLERLPEGTGIMLDDVAAGVLGLVVAQLLTRFAHLL